MPALVKDMGKAVPSFYSISGKVKGAASDVAPNLPIYAVLILVGVAIVFVLRKRSSNTGAGPVLTVNPSNDSDASALANDLQALLALGTARGGVTTPVTPPVTPPVIRPVPSRIGGPTTTNPRV